MRKFFIMPKNPKGNMNKSDGKFKEGIWAGITSLTNEIVILTEDGAKRTRTVRRVPDSEKYDLS